MYDPNNQILKGTKLAEDGIYTIQVAALKGSKTFNLDMSLGTLSPAPPSPPPSPPILSLSPSPPSPSDRLTQQEATDLVQGWYNAKPQIFGPPFDEKLVNKYATGQFYDEKLKKCNEGVCGGSVGWLRAKGCYYIYDFSTINNVVYFNFSNSPPSLTVDVRESFVLHGSKSVGCGTSEIYQKNVTYWFAKADGEWKILRYQVGD